MAEVKERVKKWIAGEICLSENPGDMIRHWRERFGINQTNLANAMRVSPSVICDYEAGRRKSPGTITIRKIVENMMKLDETGGGETLRNLSHVFGTQLPPDVVLEIREYSHPIDGKTVLKAISAEPVANKELLDQKLFGYTIIDSLKAILGLSPEDFRRLYGVTTERVLAFTGVTTGRSPMVAIRIMGITPGLVVLHGELKEIDPVAVKIAQILKVPLAVSRVPTVEELIAGLRKGA
jgi:putative transcriptional regulator